MKTCECFLKETHIFVLTTLFKLLSKGLKDCPFTECNLFIMFYFSWPPCSILLSHPLIIEILFVFSLCGTDFSPNLHIWVLQFRPQHSFLSSVFWLQGTNSHDLGFVKTTSREISRAEWKGRSGTSQEWYVQRCTAEFGNCNYFI